MSSDYSIIIDQVEIYEDYVRHIFRDLFSGPNSTFYGIIESNKYNSDTVTEVPAGELIQNATEKYNKMVAAK